MTHHKTLALTLGSTLAASFAAVPVAGAADNPFALQAIDGMRQVAEAGKKAKEGKCGEGKCAGKTKEGQCSASKMRESGGGDKIKEGNCSGSKIQEGRCSGRM